jgi:hypothetical protein
MILPPDAIEEFGKPEHKSFDHESCFLSGSLHPQQRYCLQKMPDFTQLCRDQRLTQLF